MCDFPLGLIRSQMKNTPRDGMSSPLTKWLCNVSQRVRSLMNNNGNRIGNGSVSIVRCYSLVMWKIPTNKHCVVYICVFSVYVFSVDCVSTGLVVFQLCLLCLNCVCYASTVSTVFAVSLFISVGAMTSPSGEVKGATVSTPPALLLPRVPI